MRYFEMFAGIGGFRLGIDRACSERENSELRVQDNEHSRCNKSSQPNQSKIGRDNTCIGYSEINKYAIQIYENHFKGTKNYGDATRIIPEEIPDFGLLAFGWPCTDNSIAGKRKGQTVNTRSGLLSQAVRVLRTKKPNYFIAENVPGLFSVAGGRDFYKTIKMFTDSGYDCQWQVLNTRWFLPQNRKRIFFVGHLRGTCRPKVFPIGEDDLTIKKENGRRQRGAWSTQVGTKKNRISSQTYIVETPQRHPLRFLGRNQKNIQGDYSFTIDASKTSGIKMGERVRYLTPTECERLQGFPDGWTEGISDTQRYKCLGNAVTVNVIQAIVEKIITTSHSQSG
jgi:DNA (cytosine-5)-methyltransferase 1